MKSPPAPRFRVVLLATASLLFFGCATNRQPQAAAPQGVIVEGEVMRPTGSHISHVVRKGDPAGISNDMPGAVTGTKGLEHEQNDMGPQSPITGL